MGAIPVPRSLNQVIGDISDAFLSRFGIPKLRIGSPLLSLFEAAAMSDVRSTAEIFALLNATNLDSATGTALERLAADEDLERIQETSASGFITVTDTSFTKISTRIYQGLPAPLVGTQTIYVLDASTFPSPGPSTKVYIARGAANFEGPFVYDNIISHTTYWEIHLTQPITKFHNTGEQVVLAQGGDRNVGAGSTVQTPQGTSFNAIQFSVLYPATLPDGETSIEGVVVVAKQPGVSGNVPSSAVSSFVSPPFTGATATNPAPFTNGLASENDDDLRERIKNTRRSRSKGTELAVTTAVLGLTSSDENKRVTSASLVRRLSQPTTLFIDDGTGYEEKDQGIPIEFLTDDAIGGEKFFQLTNKPITKARVISTMPAPYTILDGAELAVKVGGIASTHSFSPEDFKNPTNASAYEVVASINANSSITFSARTSDGGQNVVIFAKADVNEDLEVISAVGVDANDALAFPSGRHYTLRLYKNDRPLTKDGQKAFVESKAFSSWPTVTSPTNLRLAVDGTPFANYIFVNQDFVDAGTGFSTVGKNTLAAWVKVINAKIPGITASTDGLTLILTSNAGATAQAQIQVEASGLTGNDFVADSIFKADDVFGEPNDYQLDRNRGQIELTDALVAGDRLSVGSFFTRGFVESEDLTPVSVGTGGNVWVAVDGDAKIVSTGITTSNTFTTALTLAFASGARYSITVAGPSTPFADVAIGDWVIIWDPAAAWNDYRGMFRVAARTNSSVSIDLANGAASTFAGQNFPSTGIVLVKYNGQLQNIAVPNGTNQTADTFSGALEDSIEGANVSTWRTTKLRVRTDTYGVGGDIAIVAANTEGSKLLLPLQNADVDAGQSEEGQVGSVISSNQELGTPTFDVYAVETVTDQADFNAKKVSLTNATPTITDYDHILHGLNIGGNRFGNNHSFQAAIKDLTGSPSDNIELRHGVPQFWMPEDKFYLGSPYALGPEDQLAVLVDQDPVTNRFIIPMGRKLTTVGTTYSATPLFKDGDGSSLAVAFGNTYDFDDFAVYMQARAKSHASTATKSTLWRYKRFGSEGNYAQISHHYPAAANEDLTVNTNTFPSGNEGDVEISVVLPSGAARTNVGIRSTTRLGYGYNTGTTIPSVTIACGFPIASATRTGGNSVELTLILPSGLYSITANGIVAGQIWVDSNDPNFPSGLKNVFSSFANTITYIEAGVNITGISIGTMSFDSQGVAKFAGATPSIVIGDLVHLSGATGILSAWRNQTIKITALGDQFLQGYSETNLATSSGFSLAWSQILDPTQISFYPLDAGNSTATAISTAVNGLDASCPVTATILDSGSGTILLSTRDELLTTSAAFYQLVDGINWVKNTTKPSDYQFEFKAPIDASLTTNSDWDNEVLYVVPKTTKNATDWLNTLAVTGLSSVSEVEAANQGHHVQIATDLAGSEGSVEVQGGTANSTSASVIGTAETGGGYGLATFTAGAVAGVHGRQWVTLDNAISLPKAGVFTSATDLDSITVSGGKSTFTLTAGAVYNNHVTATDAFVQVQKQGDLVCYLNTTTTGVGTSVNEGDWAFILAPTTPGSDIDPANRSQTAGGAGATTGRPFRVVRAAPNAFWIENPGVVEESNVKCDVKFFTADSMMPGDTLSISTNLWNSNNKGTFTIDWVGDPTATMPALMFSGTTPTFKFRVSQTLTAVAPAGPGPLGSESSKVLCLEAAPQRLFKRVLSAGPNSSSSVLTDIKFTTDKGLDKVTAAAGTVMTVRDKFNFPTTINVGHDGYAETVGLLGEASRVLYGDDRDTATYPGVVSEGSSINISGPLVRRVQVSLAVRIKTGISKVDIANQVKSSVATTINSSKIGQSIAISDIVDAAAAVNGVFAVTILSPTYSAGNDLITLQPFEKALVLNVDTDVLISFVDDG